jgi:hypothetical protein
MQRNDSANECVRYRVFLLSMRHHRTLQGRSEEMKKIIVLIAVLLFCLNLPLVSQPLDQEYTHHAVYLEVGGQGILYTVNYDSRSSSLVASGSRTSLFQRSLSQI